MTAGKSRFRELSPTGLTRTISAGVVDGFLIVTAERHTPPESAGFDATSSLTFDRPRIALKISASVPRQ
jgi:hypothetical protein